MIYIYILLLKNNKYYIGKTKNPSFRLDDHFNHKGSEWTKKYHPIKVLKLISNCSNFDEDRYTKEYMFKKGINNVRGGSYCKIKLNNDEINLIQKEINSASDCCYICGSTQHFANNCNNNYDNIIINKSINKLPSLLIEENRCFRCYRIGHFAINCYATNDIHGNSIHDEDSEELIEVWCCSYCNKEFETEKGAKYHERFYCKKKVDTRNNNKCYYKCDYNY